MKRTDILHCSDFENRIHQLLDDRLILSADARLTEHAARCPECSVLMQDYEQMELAFAFVTNLMIDIGNKMIFTHQV